MKESLKLLAERPKIPAKSRKGPMRIGFDYPTSVRVTIAARGLYESLYAWISECHPEQFDPSMRDYNSLAGQTLDLFEKLSSEEDWVYTFFTLSESPRGEKYNLYNPKPFTCLFNVCSKGKLQTGAEVQMNGTAKPPPKVDDDAADKIAEKLAAKIREKPIDTRLVDVAPSAGKGLRTAMKDPGGRPKKAHGGANVMTQAEMATAFGSPCNENMVNGWEARAAGKNRGANPPDAIYNDERIIYSAELRTNPTPDNTKRLSALIAEFQSRHRLKEAVGEKARHMKSAETLAKASGQVTAAIREQSQLKYEK